MNIMIIPAAGRGSRLQYDGPKLLYDLNGKPLLDYLLNRYSPFIDQFVIVIHPDFESAVSHYLKSIKVENCNLDFQYQPTGMLDAIVAPMDKLKAELDVSKVKQVWVTWCDQVAISEQTATTLSELLQKTEKPNMVFPTFNKPQPYIHMQRDEQGNIVKVLQRREGDAMPDIGENDCGLFGLSGDAYFSLLEEFAEIDQQSGSSTQERNFLPFISWINGKAQVKTFAAQNEVESIGINTIEDAETILSQW